MLRRGTPTFATLKPYLPPNIDLRQLADFMDRTFTGRLTGDDLARIRDRWKGRLVLKGVATPEDAEGLVHQLEAAGRADLASASKRSSPRSAG